MIRREGPRSRWMLPGRRPGKIGQSDRCNKEHIMVESEATSIPGPPSKEELRLAMKAFRKRLKLTRLDDESRMGHGPMSSGLQSGIFAITPPNQFPEAVWQELAKQGKLKHDRGGLYSLVEP
jgi:hypothetical protein